MGVKLEGKDDDETDILLNPAHALVGKYGANRGMADAFADWIGKAEGGQRVVDGFEQNGFVLYTRAPREVWTEFDDLGLE